MNKYVIYTCITGGYEDVQEPMVLFPNFDYICFTDNIPLDYKGVWQYRLIDYKTEDKQRLSRLPKLKPYQFLSGYEYSLYIDANMQIVSEDIYTLFMQQVERKTLFAGVKHPSQICLYDEGFRVLWFRNEKKTRSVIQQMRYYKKKKFPVHFGMYEAGVLFRSHNHPLIKEQSDEWWRLLNLYSRRDQLSLSYTLWKFEIPIVYFLPNNECARNTKSLSYVSHVRQSRRDKSVFHKAIYPIYKTYRLVLKQCIAIIYKCLVGK